MSRITVGLIGLVIMLVAMALGVPIGFAMAIIGFIGVIYFTSLGTAISSVAGTIPYSVIANYSYIVLPLFLFMANICFRSGLGKALFNFVYKWIGRLPGGLAAAAIGACAIFGAVSASAVATALTVGLVAIPEMRRYHYQPALACATVASAGVLGILIPPSGILIIYGIMTQQSIGELFIAGVVPGIVLSLMFMIMVVTRAMLNPAIAPPGPSTSIREKVVAIGPCAEIIALILLVIGGLMVGWFTPTEAGGVGAFGAIAFSLIRRQLKWQGFKDAVMDTVTGAGMIYILLIGAFIFNAFLALSTLPQQLAGIVTSLALAPAAVMALIILIYAILGCFISGLAMILLTIPVFYPIAIATGFDPIWFGIIIVLVCGMASITPPVGIDVFVIHGIAKDVPMGAIFKGIVPFFIVECIFAGLLIAFPQIALWLPALMK